MEDACPDAHAGVGPLAIPHTTKHTAVRAHTRRGDGFEACAGTAGAENAKWPHASILARTAQRREHVGFWRPLWWSARRQLFGHSPGHGGDCALVSGGGNPVPMGKPRKGKGERKRACRSPLESGACRRSPCRRRPNATGSGRCLYAGSIHRSVFRARVLAGLPAPHAGTGSRQTRTGCDSDPTTDTNNGLCRAFRQRW